MKKKIAGAIDLRREIGGAAPIGVQLLHKPAVGLANFIAARIRADAKDCARLFNGHHSGAALSAVRVSLGAPIGMHPIEISLQDRDGLGIVRAISTGSKRSSSERSARFRPAKRPAVTSPLTVPVSWSSDILR